MEEIYKEIKGTIYSVSNLGNVKNNSTLKILKPRYSKSGYYYVDLYIDKKSNQISIHRLVAIYHVENPNNFKEVNHLDEDKTNNVSTNLEWCTHLQNMHHGNIGRRHVSKQVKVNQYDLSGNFVKEFNSCKDAEKYFNKNSSNISNCCKGRLKTAYGYKWKYSGK